MLIEKSIFSQHPQFLTSLWFIQPFSSLIKNRRAACSSALACNPLTENLVFLSPAFVINEALLSPFEHRTDAEQPSKLDQRKCLDTKTKIVANFMLSVRPNANIWQNFFLHAIGSWQGSAFFRDLKRAALHILKTGAILHSQKAS